MLLLSTKNARGKREILGLNICNPVRNVIEWHADPENRGSSNASILPCPWIITLYQPPLEVPCI